MIQSRQFALSLLTLCITQHLYAQSSPTTLDSDTTHGTGELDAIQVVGQAKTGTVLAQKISEMPAVTQVIPQEDIQAQAIGNRTTADILAQLIPSLGTSSGSTSNFGTTMRGRPVQYLLNGVPLTGSRNISRELNSIDPAQLERVEVLTGSTSIYGAGAAGGLINLVTKSMAGYGFSGQTRVGMDSGRDFESESFGYHLGQSIGYGGEQFYGRLDLDYQSKGGKFDSHGNRISPDIYQTGQQDTDSISVNANLGFDITDTQTINLAVTHYYDEQDTDYGFDYGPNLEVLTAGAQPSFKAIKGIQFDQQPETQKSSINLNYNNSDVWGSNFSLTGYYRDESAWFYPSGQTFVPAVYPEVIKRLAGPLTQAQLGQLQNNAVAVTQSEVDIKVAGVRAVMQTETNIGGKDTLFSYGFDFEREKDEQTLHGQDFAAYMASNGLVAQKNGITYNGGPDTTIDKWGAFINADVDFTDKWQASAGVRYQRIKSETDAYTPILEQLISEYFEKPTVVGILGSQPYDAGEVPAGKTDHHKTLFNLGSSFQITPNDQVFANFSQGFTTADIQRALRDVRKGFIVNSDNVQPITINSYEIGWQGNHGNTNAKVSAFYNDSDKTVRFNKDYTVEVVDTDERVYGAEAALEHTLNDHWQIGGTVAYTRGQYKLSGDWIELDATRVTPLKGTAFVQYTFDEGSNVRLQALAINGTDRAYKEQKAKDPDSNAQPITGYVTLDLLGQVNLPKGHLDYGIYNLLNKDYKTVYHQSNYGEPNRVAAEGINYGISYTIDY